MIIDFATATDDAVADYHGALVDFEQLTKPVVCRPASPILSSAPVRLDAFDKQAAIDAFNADTAEFKRAQLRTRKANVADLELSFSQHAFITMPKKFGAFIGGFGSGKTFVGCLDLLTFAMKHHGVAQGYFAPTYRLVRDIFYPTITEAAELLGLTVKIMVGNSEVEIYNGGKCIGIIICRTLDQPHNIVGFKIARALIDELDVLNAEKATEAWNKIASRMRLIVDGVINAMKTTSTPEGFRFCYDFFEKPCTTDQERARRAMSAIVHSTTFENLRFLPPDYIESLKATYSPQLVRAYLLGLFVNLNSGVVYSNFDRRVHLKPSPIDKKYALLIGVDFNVNPMSAIVMQQHNDGTIHVVDEIILENSNTQKLAAEINRRYLKDWGNRINCYPDATNGRSTTSETTDHAILMQAGFNVVTNSSNPRIFDRVNTVNREFMNYDGEHSLFIDPQCIKLIHALEAQVYDKWGKPTKDNTNDHPLDALGYAIIKLKPIQHVRFTNRSY